MHFSLFEYNFVYLSLAYRTKRSLKYQNIHNYFFTFLKGRCSQSLANLFFTTWQAIPFKRKFYLTQFLNFCKRALLEFQVLFTPRSHRQDKGQDQGALGESSLFNYNLCQFDNLIFKDSNIFISRVNTCMCFQLHGIIYNYYIYVEINHSDNLQEYVAV